MEKFESKIDSLIFIIFITFCLLDIAAFVIWVVLGIWWPTLVLVLVTILFIIPPYFFTWYKLTDDSLKITFGYFMVNRTIPYDSILSVRPVVGHSMAPALSSRRIEIIYYKNTRSRRVCVSPGMYSTFLNIITDRALESAVARNRLNPSQEERFERPAKPVAPAKLTSKKSSSPAKKTASKKSPQKKAIEKPTQKVAPKKPVVKANVNASGKKQSVNASVKPAVKKVATAKSETIKKPTPTKGLTTKKTTSAKSSTAKKPATKKVSTEKKVSTQKSSTAKKSATKKSTNTAKRTS